MNTTSTTIRLSPTHCTLYRFVGTLLLLTSLINLLVTFRYFIKRYYNRQKEFSPNRLSCILIGMSVSSILVVFAAVPFVVAQCFSCHPHLNNEIFCKLHAFICFSSGLFHM
jgi:hypothetical protein